jgi:asparagine synthase (glutamine-hydrolysing)
MCGICGFYGHFDSQERERDVLEKMTSTLVHRGPDCGGQYIGDGVALGFRRLSLIDLLSGDQPLYNADHSLVLVCNGEIYNYKELKAELQRDYQFRTQSDVEVILALYERYGYDLLLHLNGQFAFALYDLKRRTLFLARDHCGICPLYYRIEKGAFVFGSEIKAILQNPLARRELDLTGLDQVLSFPGLIGPQTMFKGIQSLKSGHYLIVEENGVRIREYWDLDYPRDSDCQYGRSPEVYLEQLQSVLTDSVRLRMQADVPVGFYLSGGLDSSLIAALIRQNERSKHLHSFSVDFVEKSFSEGPYQTLMARHVGSEHHSIRFGWEEISERMSNVIWHSECPIKESYNTASLALSESVRQTGISAVLTGEGADELFAGYVGYRFDQFRRNALSEPSADVAVENEIRERLWGDPHLFYEHDYGALTKIKRGLYSDQVNEAFAGFDCLTQELVDKKKIEGRQFIHQRSYLDFKLRMSDHLLSDHGDRMMLANSVEGRYPFLDPRVVDLATKMPPGLKLNGYVEKYALRRIAEKVLPAKVARREKYAFVAPGSPYLLNQNLEWVEDTLSTDRIRREGYFDHRMVETLKHQYRQPGFKLNIPFETDLLMIVLTFGLFLENFAITSTN